MKKIKNICAIVFAMILSMSTVSVAYGADIDTAAKDGCDDKAEVVWNADGSLVVVSNDDEYLVGFRFGTDFYPVKDDAETKLGPAIARDETEDSEITYLDGYAFVEDEGTDISPLLRYFGKLWHCGAVQCVFPEGWTYRTASVSEGNTSGIEVNLQAKTMTFVGTDLEEMLEKGITTLRFVAGLEAGNK